MATQVLVGAPNIIEEDIIKQTMDEELKISEKNAAYEQRLQANQEPIKEMDLIRGSEGISSRNAMERKQRRKSKSKELITPGLPMCSTYTNLITKG